MEKIYICNCGCGVEVWLDNEVYITSPIIETSERVDYVRDGFVNGKHSLPQEALDIIEFNMGFV